MSGARGEIARARSALEAAQSDLYSVQLKLAPLRQQEQRALERVAIAARALRVVEGADAAHALHDPDNRTAHAIVELARLYEGRAPCDTEQ